MKNLPAALLLLSLASAASAQQAPPSNDKHDWGRVQSLPIGTIVLLNSATHHGSCKLTAVAADSLTCASGAPLSRAEIKSIKLPRRLASAAVGLAIGAGAGYTAGYVAAGPDTSGGGFNILSRSDVGGIFAIGGGFLGAIIGYFTHFASSTVYHTP